MKTFKSRIQEIARVNLLEAINFNDMADKWHGGMTGSMSYEQALKWLKSDKALSKSSGKVAEGVYSWWHKTEEFCAVVGESGNILRRMIEYKDSFMRGKGYISKNGNTKGVSVAYKMKKHDPDFSNWVLKIRIIPIANREIRQRVEAEYESHLRPRFNNPKMLRKSKVKALA